MFECVLTRFPDTPSVKAPFKTHLRLFEPKSVICLTISCCIFWGFDVSHNFDFDEVTVSLLLVKTGKMDCIFYENRQENRGNIEKWLYDTVSCCFYFLCRPITHSNKMQYISTKSDWALGGCLDNINACSLYAFISSKQPPKVWHVSTEMYCILLLCNYYNTYFNDDVDFAWLFFFWWLQTWFLNFAHSVQLLIVYSRPTVKMKRNLKCNTWVWALDWFSVFFMRYQHLIYL